jgi:GT2 family glycosyltransferase
MTVPVVIPRYGECEVYDEVVTALKEQGGLVFAVVDETGEGFTKTVNRGLREVIEECEEYGWPYVWILNQDAVPLPGAIEVLVKWMDEHPHCGIAASMQIHPDNGDMITFGGSGPVMPGVHYTGYISEGQYLDPKQMGWANGAAMMVRLDMLREIGLLDENMRMLSSDADISFRARLAGWDVWYVPDSRVRHTLSFSSNPPDSQKWAAGEDQRAFMEKWNGPTFKDLAMEVFD